MKAILLILFSVLTTNIYSQVNKYWAFTSLLYNNSEHAVEKANDVQILVTVDINDGKRIKTFGEREGDYDVIKVDSVVYDTDGNRKAYMDIVDTEGIKCRCVFTLFANELDYSSATLMIIYKDYSLIFRLKNRQ